jgi:hypothetical protein
MRVHLCIISATPELFLDAAEHALSRATGRVTLLGLGNGCVLSPPVGSVAAVQCDPQNHGVPWALHQLYKLARNLIGASSDDLLVYIHDDFRILEKGWDERVARVFERDPKCGLAGFGGSTALGGDEIYRAPYEVHQLGRRDFFSNMNGAELHGQRTTEERPIVFTDGQSMIVKRELLDKIGGWSWWPFELVHHAYDYGIACMARRHGYSAWLVPCAVEHRGGLTACGPVYQALAASLGGDAAVHAASHRFVYDSFRDVLPLRLP